MGVPFCVGDVPKITRVGRFWLAVLRIVVSAATSQLSTKERDSCTDSGLTGSSLSSLVLICSKTSSSSGGGTFYLHDGHREFGKLGCRRGVLALSSRLITVVARMKFT